MSRTDVLELLGRHNPIGVDDVAGAAATPEAAALRERILATASTGAVPRRNRRRPLLVAAAATLVTAAVALVPATLLPDERLGASPAAAQTLQRLASVAASQPAAAPGRYVYLKALVVDSATNTDVPYTFLIRRTRESWLAPDGSGRIRASVGEPIFFSERDRGLFENDHRGLKQFPASDERFGPRAHLAYDANLPTDPDELEAALRRSAEVENPPPEDGYRLAGEMLEKISSLLYLPAASPELRAALYQVMTRIQGVELLGERNDPLGRRGIAFARAGGYGKDTSTRVLLIVDPQTSQVLAQETELVRPVDWVDTDPPVLLSSIAYLETGWADELGAQPAQ